MHAIIVVVCSKTIGRATKNALRSPLRKLCRSCWCCSLRHCCCWMLLPLLDRYYSRFGCLLLFLLLLLLLLLLLAAFSPSGLLLLRLPLSPPAAADHHHSLAAALLLLRSMRHLAFNFFELQIKFFKSTCRLIVILRRFIG